MFSHIPCGDLELNLFHPRSCPTLVPSPGLEERLDFRCTDAPASERHSMVSGEAPRLGIHMHAFYLATLPELVSRLGAVLEGLTPFDLWVSTDSSAKASTIRDQLAASPLGQRAQAVQVQVCPNQGRNLGPLLLHLWPELCRYDLLLHLHGKQSVETQLGHAWCQQLLTTLLSDAAAVRTIQQAFAAQPQLGLLMPQPPMLMRPYLNWGSNFELARELARSMGRGPLHREAVLLFPAGAMFWCRPAALEPLAKLLRKTADLPLEPLGVDGTSLHAIERLIGHGCEASGHSWRLIGAEPPGPATTAASLSLWDPCPDAYLQATALLAKTARQHAEELVRYRSDYDNCIRQLEAADAQLTAADEQLRQTVADSLAQIAERDAWRQQVQQSWSWKLSGPLRRLERRLRR